MHTASVPAHRSRGTTLRLTVMGELLSVDLPVAALSHTELARRAWSRCAAGTTCPTVPAETQAPRPVRAALEDLTTSVTLRGIRHHRGRSLMFHAAGLADPATGGTAVLVAPSGTGKTTAARSLGNRLAYVSDETVCVDPADLSIAPYPKPLSVVTGPGEPKDQVSPDDLGLLPLECPAHARSILLLQRSAGGGSPHVTQPLPLVTALATLVPNISALPSLRDPLVTLVRVVDACGGVRAVRYREIDGVAPQLVDAASTPPVPTVRAEPLVHWEPERAASSAVPGPGAEAPDADPQGADAAVGGTATPAAPDRSGAGHDSLGESAGARTLPATVVPGPWVQALENPEDHSQLLLLLPERLVVLAGIGPLIWHACREGGARSPEELTATLVAACAGHPEAGRLTGESVAHLLHLDVLRPGPARG